MSQTNNPLKPTAEDIRMMLAAEVHLGTKNVDQAMEPYVWKRRSDGVHLINVNKTWEKIMLAARAVAAIDNPRDVCVISARPYGQRAVMKFGRYTSAQSLASRFTPGTFTNQIQAKFMEPRLLIVTDPRQDAQPINEASYVNVPVIALCSTESPLKYVDLAIPCNNKGRYSIGLVYYLICREVLRLRGTIPRSQPWDVMVDMFFYRDPEEIEEQEKAQAAAATAGDAQEAGGDAAAAAGFDASNWTQDGNWDQAGGDQWGGDAQWSGPQGGAAPAPAAGAGYQEQWGGRGAY